MDDGAKGDQTRRYFGRWRSDHATFYGQPQVTASVENGALLIVGAGGHGKVVADTAIAAGYDDVGFLDDYYPDKQIHGGWPLRGTPDMLTPAALFCGIGANDVRARLFDRLPALRTAPVLVHPSAILSPSVTSGAGTLIVAGSIVNAGAMIGVGVILNTGCSVDHDCSLGDFVHISPGARLAGGVQVGAGTWIGIGAVVREGVRIGRNVMVGAGAAVICDLPDNTRVGGVPAQPIGKKNPIRTKDTPC